MFDFLFKLNDLYIYTIQTLSKISLTKLIFLTVIIEFTLSLIFAFLLFPNHSAGPQFETKLEEFFLVVIIAPFIETLIFQYTIISFFLNKWPRAVLFTIVFSAIIFGLSHFYSQVYILKTFISGLLFGTLYIVVNAKNSSPIIAVTLAHSIYNFIGFCLRQI